jgi:hypothetical protein
VDSELGPTSAVEAPVTELWEMREYQRIPQRHIVLARTAKTYTVKHDHGYGDDIPASRHTVKQADIGHTWFISELDAMRSAKSRLDRKLDWNRQEAQRLRSTLGEVESRIRALSAGEAQPVRDAEGVVGKSEPGNA